MSSSLAGEIMVDDVVLWAVDIDEMAVPLFSVDVMLSLAFGTCNWTSSWAKNTGMIDLRKTNVNTRKPSKTQLLQNELNRAFLNCGFRFFRLALINSFSHSLKCRHRRIEKVKIYNDIVNIKIYYSGLCEAYLYTRSSRYERSCLA